MRVSPAPLIPHLGGRDEKIHEQTADADLNCEELA
jgi:hypothetical protein